MESKIIFQEKNPFFGREEIRVEFNSETTPSFDEVKRVIGKEENLIVVKKIDGNFGKKTFIAEAFVYDSEDIKKDVETIPKKIRAKMEADAKAAAEAKAAEEASKKAEEAAAPEATEEATPAEEAAAPEATEEAAPAEEAAAPEENKEQKTE